MCMRYGGAYLFLECMKVPLFFTENMVMSKKMYDKYNKTSPQTIDDREKITEAFMKFLINRFMAHASLACVCGCCAPYCIPGLIPSECVNFFATSSCICALSECTSRQFIDGQPEEL